MAPFETAQSLSEVEREHILRILERCRGNRTRAAKLLGISIRGLRQKLIAYVQAGFAVPPPATIQK
jgi:DNA-binding protein Fis